MPIFHKVNSVGWKNNKIKFIFLEIKEVAFIFSKWAYLNLFNTVEPWNNFQVSPANNYYIHSSLYIMVNNLKHNKWKHKEYSILNTFITKNYSMQQNHFSHDNELSQW